MPDKKVNIIADKDKGLKINGKYSSNITEEDIKDENNKKDEKENEEDGDENTRD